MRRILFVFFALLLSSATAWGGTLPFRDYKLDNGLRVILVREAKAPVVVVQAWYRVGAIDEVAGKTGLAHMLEHMMFQGTKKLAPGEYSKIISRNGGSDNASTAQDYTNYYAKLASDRLELALELEADRMVNLVIKPKEFEQENKVVREERRLRTDNKPIRLMLEQFRAEVFRKHPYGRPIIGPMADIKGHTLADLEAWYQRHYAPNNAILVIVGAIGLDDAAALVEKHFGPIPPRPGLKRAPRPAEPPQTEPRRVEYADPDVALPVWVAGYKVPSLSAGERPEDTYALDVLTTILGDGASSRLHRSLVVEGKLATSAGSGFPGVSLDPGMLSVSVSLRPKVAVETVEKAVFAEVARFLEEPPGEQEMEKAKNQLAADHIYAQDSVYEMAGIIGRLAVTGADWKLLFTYPERIRRVTQDQVVEVARRYLTPERATVGVLLPQNPKAAREGNGHDHPGS